MLPIMSGPQPLTMALLQGEPNLAWPNTNGDSSFSVFVDAPDIRAAARRPVAPAVGDVRARSDEVADGDDLPDLLVRSSREHSDDTEPFRVSATDASPVTGPLPVLPGLVPDVAVRFSNTAPPAALPNGDARPASERRAAPPENHAHGCGGLVDVEADPHLLASMADFPSGRPIRQAPAREVGTGAREGKPDVGRADAGLQKAGTVEIPARRDTDLSAELRARVHAHLGRVDAGAPPLAGSDVAPVRPSFQTTALLGETPVPKPPRQFVSRSPGGPAHVTAARAPGKQGGHRLTSEAPTLPSSRGPEATLKVQTADGRGARESAMPPHLTTVQAARAVAVLDTMVSLIGKSEMLPARGNRIGDGPALVAARTHMGVAASRPPPASDASRRTSEPLTLDVVQAAALSDSSGSLVRRREVADMGGEVQETRSEHTTVDKAPEGVQPTGVEGSSKGIVHPVATPEGFQAEASPASSRPVPDTLPTHGTQAAQPAQVPHMRHGALAMMPAPDLPAITGAAGGDRYEIALSPKELGHLRLTLHHSEQGLSVVVSADRSETLDLVWRHLPELDRDLRALGHGAVQFSFHGGSGFGDDSRHTFAPHTIDDADRPSADTVAAVTSPLHALPARGALDLRL